MAKKSNLKSVRLSDQVMDYVINFEGDGFNQKFENLVLFCMEQEETKKQRITLLDQQIAKQYKKLYALQQLSSEIGDVRRALTHLERQANDLSELMDELLEDKDEDQELPFP
jgi:predicted transcriptional regulator